MKRFVQHLKSIEERLDLPQPLKSRIILEIAADMEDLFNHFKEKGMGDEEAITEVERKMEITEDSLEALSQVHKSGLQRLLDRLDLQTRNRWEKVVLVLTILILAVLSLRSVLAIPMITRSSIFVWPILGIGFMGLTVFFMRSFQLYIARNHEPRSLRRGLPLLLFFAGSSFMIGILGYLMEILKAGKHGILMDYKIIYMISPNRLGPDLDLQSLTTWMMQSASLIMVSMLVTISMAFLWFILFNKVQRIERVAVEWLVGE
jgi:hypothetical protein